MSELTPILQAAKDILAEAKKELHVNEIAEIAAGKNKTLGMDKVAFAEKLSGALAAHLKTKAQIFGKPLNKQGRPRKGVYRLRKTAITTIPVIKAAPPAANTLYLGKAGEYAVASELLFWGFNVSMMAVDQGIDLVAEKDGKFRHLQVKTSTISADDRPFGFAIQQRAFDANQHLNPWYVFAMRQGVHTDYAVIPSTHLLHLRSTGLINGKDFSIQITRDSKGKQYKLNGSHDINMYINNFGLI